MMIWLLLAVLLGEATADLECNAGLVSCGTYQGCLIDHERALHCFGLDEHWVSVVSDMPDTKNFRQVAAGGDFACALDMENTLICWGKKDSDAKISGYPRTGKYKKLGTLGTHACVMDFENNVVCWGQNTYGQLNIPNEKFIDVAVLSHCSCGIKEDDLSIKCWGHMNYFTDKGIPTSGQYKKLFCKDVGCCAINLNDEAVCWGRKQHLYEAPDKKFDRIAVGSNGVQCGITVSKELICWGYDGQLIVSDAPTSGRYLDVSIGHFNACAVTEAGGNFVCWGKENTLDNHQYKHHKFGIQIHESGLKAPLRKCQETYPFSRYRIKVLSGQDESTFCLETFRLYDENENKLELDLRRSSANPDNKGMLISDSAFDSKLENDSNYYFCSPNNYPTGSLEYAFPDADSDAKKIGQKLSRYELQAMVHIPGPNQRAPLAWQFQGSNDGFSWTTIAVEETPNTWKNGEVRSFEAQPSTMTWLEVGSGVCPDIEHRGTPENNHDVKSCRDRCDRDFHETYFSLYEKDGEIKCSCYNDCDSMDDTHTEAQTYEILSDTVQSKIENSTKDVFVFCNKYFDEYEATIDVWKSRFLEIKKLELSSIAEAKFPLGVAVGDANNKSNVAADNSRFYDRLFFTFIGAASFGLMQYGLFNTKANSGDQYNSLSEI